MAAPLSSDEDDAPMAPRGPSHGSCRSRDYFRCAACMRHLAAPYLLLEHYRNEHPEHRPFACELCVDTFRYVQELKAHRLGHIRGPACDRRSNSHLNGPPSRSASASCQAQNSTAVGKPFKCTECLQTFTVRDGLMAHLTKHVTELSSPASGATSEGMNQTGSTGSNPSRHQARDQAHNPCPQCPKKFSSRFHLTEHLQSHTGERPFACPQCSKKLSTQRSLNLHLQLHAGSAPYPCTQCPKKYLRKQGLVVHLRAHTGELPFACSLCPKKFIRKGDLDLHTRTHTGERPYKCGECSLTFKCSSHLHNHNRRIHASCPKK